MDLQSIERLIEQGQLDKTEKEIEKIVDPDLANYFRSKLYTRLGEYQKALDLINQVLKNQNEASNRYFDMILLKANLLKHCGEYTQCMELIAKLQSQDPSLHQQVRLSSVQLSNYFFMGQFEKAIETGSNALQLKNIENYPQEKAKILKNMGSGFYQLGEYDTALDYYERSLRLSKSLGLEDEIAILQNNLGLVRYSTGDLEGALDYYTKSLEGFARLDLREQMASVYSNIGLVYQSQNQFSKATKQIKNSLEIHQTYGNEYYIAICQTNLGKIYLDKGNFDLSKQYLNKAIRLKEKLGNDYQLAETYNAYGRLLHHQGNYKKGKKYLHKALELRRRIGNDNMLTNTLYSLIKLEIKEDADVATRYFSELQQIAKSSDNRYIAIRYQLSQALILRHSKRIKHQSQAQMTYERLLEEDLPHYHFYIDIIRNLFELLVDEITYTKEIEILDELGKLGEFMLDLAHKQNSSELLAESYVLRAKIELINMNVEHAKQLIMKALKIAEDNELYLLILQISDELDSLLENIQQLNDTPHDGEPLDQKLNLLEFDNFISMLDSNSSTMSVRDHDVPLSFVILREHNVVFHHNFEKYFSQTIDSELVELMSSKLQKHVGESIEYDLFRYGTYSVVYTIIDQLVVGYIFEGRSYSAIQKFNSILTIVRASDLLQEMVSDQLLTLSSSIQEELRQIINNTFNLEDQPDRKQHDTNQLQTQIVRPLPILKNYEILLHPIRLIIVKLLTSHYSLLRSDILELTGLNSGTLQSHLDTLEKSGWIAKEMEFVEGRPRSVLYIENKGTKKYREFMDLFRTHILEF